MKTSSKSKRNVPLGTGKSVLGHKDKALGVLWLDLSRNRKESPCYTYSCSYTPNSKSLVLDHQYFEREIVLVPVGEDVEERYRELLRRERLA